MAGIRDEWQPPMKAVHAVVGALAIGLSTGAAVYGGWCWWRAVSSSRWFWRLLIPLMDGYIALSETSAREACAAFPQLRCISGSVIPHGDYRSSYPTGITQAESIPEPTVDGAA